MSILLIVLFLLAIFHFFYQAVVVKTNNELFDIDLTILKHEMDVFEIKNLKTLNVSESEFLEDTKSFIKHCPDTGKKVTAVEMILDIAEYKSSKEFEGHAQRIRSLKIQNETIWKFNVEASRYILRNVTSNASLFLFVLSPLLFLVFFYALISGNKLSIEQSVERISSKHC
ncbi:MAG: hypothetical protein RR605_00865 [Acinetobacter sp.]